MGHRKDREAEACGGGFSVTAVHTYSDDDDDTR